MYVWLAGPLVAGAMLTSCNGKKGSTTSAPAPAPRPSSAPAGAPTAGPGSTASAGAGKTCPAGTTQGTINGASKCLAPG